MKTTYSKKYITELINSGITLTAKERKIVEDYIESKSTPVNPQHLNHYKCLAAIREESRWSV